MRLLYQRSTTANYRGYTEPNLIGGIYTATGCDLRKQFITYVHRKDSLNYSESLRAVGIDIKSAASDGERKHLLEFQKQLTFEQKAFWQELLRSAGATSRVALCHPIQPFELAAKSS